MPADSVPTSAPPFIRTHSWDAVFSAVSIKIEKYKESETDSFGLLAESKRALEADLHSALVSRSTLC